MRVAKRVLVPAFLLLLSAGVPFWSGQGAAQTPSPDQVGQWSDPFLFVPANPIAPIHMTVLPDGRVLAWNGPGGGIDVDDHLAASRDHTPAVVWDPNGATYPGTFTQVPLDVDPPADGSEDLFCSGHALLPNGDVFVAGGHAGRRTGIKEAAIFRYSTNTWADAADMAAARWYPTNTVLESGRVLVASGSITPGAHNNIPEVYDPANNTWQPLPQAQNRIQSNYPFTYQSPCENLVFDAGEKADSSYLNTVNGEWMAVANSGREWKQASSVMYDAGKVLNVGGGANDADDEGERIAKTIDLSGPTIAAWGSAGLLNHNRRNHNATILADGTVLVTGGEKCDQPSETCNKQVESTYVYIPERWNAVTPTTWTVMANMKMPRKRAYHSTAILLPDGRVVTAGGERNSVNPPGHFPYTAEFYSPPYLFKGSRPTITSAPASVGYGQTFTVTSLEASSITTVTWIRLSSVTHGFNQNQRLNYLSFSPVAGGLSIIAPSNSKISPPGHYMLFILNGNGVPSVAKIIQIQ